MLVAFFQGIIGGTPSSPTKKSRGTSMSTLTCVACYDKVEVGSTEMHEYNALVCSSENEEFNNNNKKNSTSHVTCGNCIQEWIKAEIKSNNLFPCCPDYACDRKLNDNEIHGFVGEEKFKNIQLIRLSRQIEADPLARWCPNPKCSSVVKRPNIKTKKMSCLTCHGKSFCSDCACSWSHGHSFVCHGEDVSVKKWTHKNRTLSSRMNFIAEKTSQRCPTCKTRIEKDGGCNHIICWSCQSEWCWLCARNYTSNHFSDPINGCPGMQYSTINVWGKSTSCRTVRKIVGGSLAIGVGAAVVGVAVGVGVAVAPIMAAKVSVQHVVRRREVHKNRYDSR